MTLEIFRAVTPFITLLLMIGLGVIGWLVKRLITENGQHFADLTKELKHKIDQRSWELEKRMDKLERDLEKLEGMAEPQPVEPAEPAETKPAKPKPAADKQPTGANQ